MKITISVPQELWNEAQELNPGLNPSHLVQEALTALIAEVRADSDHRFE